MAEQIKCLGKTFATEEERREFFRNELRKFLPELKRIEGFPIGEDEDIIALSDPPYYTTCPNPWLNDFITEWEKEKRQMEVNNNRNPNFIVKEPYAYDVKEGKSNKIYNAHSYHTKVPHPAVMRYILHYTQAGDIVFDGFAGTGMTGVAAQHCRYPDSQIKHLIETEFKINKTALTWGSRPIIESDLSPIASFIAYNLNNEFDYRTFEKTAKEILAKTKQKFGWIYETEHDSNKKGEIIYNVWADIISCSNCSKDFSFWKSAVDLKNHTVQKEYKCPHCNSIHNNNNAQPSLLTQFDTHYQEIRQIPKQELVLTSYKVGKRRFLRSPNEYDFNRIKLIENYTGELGISKNLMFFKGESWGDTWRAGVHLGIKYWSDFYSKSNIIILSHIYNQILNLGLDERIIKALLFWFTASQSRLHRMNRYSPQHQRHVGPMANTYYISPTPAEISPFYFMDEKIKDLKYFFKGSRNSIVGVNSANSIPLRNDSIDYIFTDPPFGDNIMYSELNFIWESWLGIYTNNLEEAIASKAQNKSFLKYQDIMTSCFKEYFRILKPGKWMTVEFSNTSAAIWNGIRTALQRAGFIISSVYALNKGRGGMQAIIGVTAVNQDLVISCYKASSNLDSVIKNESQQSDIWNFVSEYLNHLPVHVKIGNITSSIVERTSKILYDKLITFFLMHGMPIPIDAKEFHDGLKIRYDERDGMFFLPEQIIEYEKNKAASPDFVQLSFIVTTESEGIDWLKRELKEKSLKYQDIQPKWMQAITAVRKGDILPELRDLLQQNFIEESDGTWRVPDMNEAKDREILRNKVLLREFSEYVEIANNSKAKKMKEVRVEALRAGFKSCWERKDFETIVKLSEKIPQNLLLEDEQLLMYYDIAKDRV